MSFTPASPLSFIYIQGTTSTFSQRVDFVVQNIFGLPVSAEVISVPDWLDVYNLYIDRDERKIIFWTKINNAYGNGMQPGDYTDRIQIRYRTFGGVIQATLSPRYRINLKVVAVTPLQLSPTVFPFTYIIGNQNPQNLTLNITSASTWNIISSQNWVTLSQNTGVNNGSVFVGVDPSGLAVGQYSAIISVRDNTQIERTATVTLSVTQGDTAVDFLFVNPQNLEFVSQVAQQNTTTQNIAIEASGNWAATASEPWLLLSQTTGTSGVNSIEASVDSVSLTDTSIPYLAQITFIQGNLQKTVFVQLFLVAFLQTGIESETLYFSDDRNNLQVTNVTPNMFLFLEGVLNNGIRNIIYKLNAPYQNGLAKILFGMETNVALNSFVPTANFSSRIQNNILPVNIKFSAFNKQLFSGATTPITSWSNVRFLKGKTPIQANVLCYVPNVVHLTKNAVLSLSCLSVDPVDQIIITGDVEQTINTSIAGNLYVYNAILNLAELNVSVGNTITVTFGSVTITVIIKPEGIDHNIIAFENEWREYEMFECTGQLIVENNADSTLTEIQTKGDILTKTVSIDNGKEYTLNTGQIYSQSEIDWLSNILQSKRLFIYQNNIPVEILLNSKKLEVYKTRTAFNAYKLKFKKARIV